MLALRLQILEMAHAVDIRRRKLAERKRQAQRSKRVHVDPFKDISEVEFVKTFRLGKETVKELIEELTPHIPNPRRNDGISVEMKILIALAFFASGSYQTSVGQSTFHNVSQNTVSRAVRQVTEALNQRTIFLKYVKWPMQLSERNDIKSKFYEKFGWPDVLGCIDGTLVAIRRPNVKEKTFYNRKGYHSLKVMIICDTDLSIRAVDASHPGSARDSSVWQNHPLNQHLIELANYGEQAFLLGDSGYPLQKTMQTPILNTVEGTPQHHYNNKHVYARNTVEQCIGVLKARFRCLLIGRALHYIPTTAGKIVNACCVLHNIANANNAPVPPLTPEEANAESLLLQQDEHYAQAEPQNQLTHVNQDFLEGRALQQALVDRLWRDSQYYYY